MLNLCCAFGGRSDEYEVSLQSVYGVLQNADKAKYNLIKLGITREGKWYLYTGDDENIKNGSWIHDEANLHPAHLSQTYGDRNLYTEEGAVRIDVLFPVMHGTHCEDGDPKAVRVIPGGDGLVLLSDTCPSSAAAASAIRI